MGAYLSEPVLEKHSEDGDSDYLSFGSSSMQGWRVSQEDAHNSILSYGEAQSFFAVYDGHGGHEVAAYCALKLPQYIRDNAAFKAGQYEKALEESFVSFDARLVERGVVEELKQLAGCTEEPEEEREEQREEVNHLCEEASMPIEAVIAKLASGGKEAAAPLACSKEGAGPGKADLADKAQASNPALRKLQEEKKPVSPFLRAKTAPSAALEGASNKHIHFNEDGSLRENGGAKDEVKTEVGAEEKEKAPSTPVNGEPVKEESVENSPEGSEKENKDTNGADRKSVV